MPALKNIRHERFAQNVVSGLSLSAAYVAAGYKDAGASANAARLIRTPSVSSRIDELQNEVAAKFRQLREERLSSLQQRIDSYNERRQRLLADERQARFTLEELIQMRDAALKEVERREQQGKETSVTAGAVSSAEDNALAVTAQVVVDVEPKAPESAEVDPDIPEWMR